MAVTIGSVSTRRRGMGMMRPTNLLYLFSDQHTRRALGCMGHGVVRTPNLDRLAERGTLLRNGYTNGPICVPARGSLATGRHVHDIGIWDNCKPYCGQFPSWGHRLIAQGHRAVSIGKLHYRSTDDANGFDPEILPMHILDGVGLLLTIVRDPLPQSKKFPLLVHESGGGESSYTDYDRRITEQAIRWLETEGTRDTGKPWTLFVSLVCPHPPWRAPEPFYSMYPHEDIDLPVAYGEGERPRHPGLEDFRHYFNVAGTFDEATLRRVIASYYGMITYLDDNIGKLLDTLERCGLADDTRVLYTSDHGESMGQKGMFSKCNMFDESTGVPMILAGPDVPRGVTVDTPAQLLDVFPTVLQATGARPVDEDLALPGTSLLEIANGARPDRDILSQHHSAGTRSAVYMLRRDNLKYVHYVDYPPSLYDLADDPLELRDRAADPAYADRLAQCRDRLRRLVDPEAVDRAAKDDQNERIERNGGIQAIIAKGTTGYTPAPGETPEFVA
ncbi:MAG: sulfatase-like hydrolase/transferase [Ectothiorhodospiraceae bacterium]|nr:sulfatase-like hydrolase/transferase [Chromatiales bacterium]MCP5156399.1 sulfatase-like hydrolase/transferase [Ectothiorhodospiraceae bacterium]